MTSKERILTAAELGRPDRVPMDFNANPATGKRLMADLGVDILDPIQVSAAEMDPVRIKAEYGSRICLHGSIDTQYVLPQGSPQQVAENIRKMIDILGPAGGFILAPCHVLQTDVPTGNVGAMYQTGHEYGVYNAKK